MSYIKIKNPIEVEVKTGFGGEYHVIPAGETKSFPEPLALQFLEVYGFLERVADEIEEVAEVEVKTSELKVKTKKK